MFDLQVDAARFTLEIDAFKDEIHVVGFLSKEYASI